MRGDVQLRHLPHSKHSPRSERTLPPSVSKPASWALEHINARRRREQYFGSNLFKDPAWDILLELFIAHTEGRTVRITEACRVTATSTSTGLRWIGTLEAENLIERESDTNDGRSSFIHLSSTGLKIMSEYLEDVAEAHHVLA